MSARPQWSGEDDDNSDHHGSWHDGGQWGGDDGSDDNGNDDGGNDNGGGNPSAFDISKNIYGRIIGLRVTKTW